MGAARKKIIGPNYHQKLAQLTGVGAAGIAMGLIAAPALLAPALIASGIAGIGSLSGQFQKRCSNKIG